MLLNASMGGTATSTTSQGTLSSLGVEIPLVGSSRASEVADKGDKKDADLDDGISAGVYELVIPHVGTGELPPSFAKSEYDPGESTTPRAALAGAQFDSQCALQRVLPSPGRWNYLGNAEGSSSLMTSEQSLKRRALGVAHSVVSRRLSGDPRLDPSLVSIPSLSPARKVALYLRPRA
jgi:hypothetical protein